MSDKLIVWLLVGAPGSGKSTFGKTLVEGDPRVVRVCPDEFRALIGGSESNQAVSYPAFEATYNALRCYLDNGKCVVVDATNMYRKSRKKFIQIARSRGAQVIAMVFELPKETLLKNIAKRVASGGRNVSEKVVDDMLARYQRPDETEVDKVTFVHKLP